MQTEPTHSPRRILIGLRDVAGYGSALKSGFDLIGVEADFLNLGGSQFDYPSTPNSYFVEYLNSIGKKFGSLFTSNFLLRFVWLVLFQPLLSLIILPFLLIRYDSFVMLSSSTFFFFLELPILKLLRKKIIYVFLGTDSRPAYLNGYVTGLRPTTPRVLFSVSVAFFQKITVRIIDHFATQVVNTPPQALFHSRDFINLFQVGLPVLTSTQPTHYSSDSAVRILHAPSKAMPKRSAQIETMIHELQKEGHVIQYVKIQGRPNHEVITELRECDLIIDEVYSDTPLSKFAAEAASNGKPALIGSYYADSIQLDLDSESLPPSFFIHPDILKDTLRKILINGTYRKEVGISARNFVEKNWSTNAVAEKFVRILSDDIPKKWFSSPTRLHYVHGCGLSENEICEIVKSIDRSTGKWGLGLSDKPELIKRLMRIMQKPEATSER